MVSLRLQNLELFVSYHLKEFCFHEGFDQLQYSIKERDNVHDMDSVQFAWQTLLEIMEKLSQSAYVRPHQMEQGHAFHVKENDQSLSWSLDVQTGI